MVARTDDPLIIEPIVFTQRYQPREDHYWYCYTELDHTTDCYMHGVPNDGHSWQPLITDQSPELRYNNVYVQTSGTYYLWACGLGDSYNDDSLHMGYGDSAPASSQQMSGFYGDDYGWAWWSVRMDSTRPYFAASAGDRIVNVWMREDGLRIDRLLLSRDEDYDPTDNIRCGGY